MTTVFVAYPSGNDFHETIVKEAAVSASVNGRTIMPWSTKDPSGDRISRSVEAWIEESDSFIADIAPINLNVTYEIGFAAGLGKPVRLICSTHSDFKPVKEIGLFDGLAHDKYDFQKSLTRIFCLGDKSNNWNSPSKNKDQPVFILNTPVQTDALRITTSAIKKIARMKFRGFSSSEISRLTATEAFEHVAASFGFIGFWMIGDSDSVRRNNQRNAFMFGVARGLGMPAYLLAHEDEALPLDMDDQATRWSRLVELDKLMLKFRDEVADYTNDFVQEPDYVEHNLLEAINFGDPVAENEASFLRDYFLETDAFSRAINGQANVLVGRKGSGKSAIFLQVRDRVRVDKSNIVVDLMPDGYQLIKLKENIVSKLQLGAKKEVISAFWEYILWLEIAHKVLEKDSARAKRDYELMKRHEELEALFRKRVDTGIGDFSERLNLLTDNIVDRFNDGVSYRAENLLSSEVLEIVYGQDISELRDAILNYLKLKGFVLFLFDNLDRIWTPGGFDADDAIILIGLVEAMQEVSRKFSKRSLDFHWAMFVRSDVYEFLIGGMADYGKLAVHSLEWSDRDQLASLFDERLRSNLSAAKLGDSWKEISVQSVGGKRVHDFLIDGSLMRPRYLIRLFETARRRALTFDQKKIREEDYKVALKELGWQVLEDLDREISDIVPDSSEFLFEILTEKESLTPDKLRYLAGKRISDKEKQDRLIDVMIWNGSLGVKTPAGDRFIFDTGYKRSYLGTIIRSNPSVGLVIHNTLSAAVD